MNKFLALLFVVISLSLLSSCATAEPVTSSTLPVIYREAPNYYNLKGNVKEVRTHFKNKYNLDSLPDKTKQKFYNIVTASISDYVSFNKDSLMTDLVIDLDSINQVVSEILKEPKRGVRLFDYSQKDLVKKEKMAIGNYNSFPVRNPAAMNVNQFEKMDQKFTHNNIDYVENIYIYITRIIKIVFKKKDGTSRCHSIR